MARRSVSSAEGPSECVTRDAESAEDLVKLAIKLVKGAKIPEGYRAVVVVTDSEKFEPGEFVRVGVSSSCTTARHMHAILHVALHGGAMKMFEDVVDMPAEQTAKLRSGE